MEPRGVPGIPAEYDAGINRGLGVPELFYHFAFEVGSRDGLEAKRAELIAKGVRVTPVVDHEWMKSIYFKDPNGLLLEYCCFTRNLNDDDAGCRIGPEVSIRRMGLEGETAPAESARSGARLRSDPLGGSERGGPGGLRVTPSRGARTSGGRALRPPSSALVAAAPQRLGAHRSA